MHLQIAVACDAAIDYTNRLCILGTFDTIQTRDFPVAKTQCSFVFQIGWGKSEEGVHSVQVRFMDELPHNATGKVLKHELPRD